MAVTERARVRPMKLDDAAGVAALAGQLGYPATRAQMERRLRDLSRDADSCLLVAEGASGGVIGWIHVFGCQVLESDPWAEVGGLVVDEGARGVGIGTTLMAAAERWAAGRGYTHVCLRSNVVRNRAHAFYQRLGYEIMKTQHKFRKKLKGTAGR